MDKIIGELKEKQNIRANLSSLRTQIKEEEACSALRRKIKEEEGLWLSFLESEDAKTRKNAALLFGELSYEGAKEALWSAYIREETLFVRSAYLTALSAFDVSDRLDALHKRLDELVQSVPKEENKKHEEEELRALRRLLISHEGITRHTFDMKGKKQDVILVTNRMHREVVRKSLDSLGAALHPLGVKVCTDDPGRLFAVRTFRELLFEIKTKTLLPAEPKEAAQLLMKGNFLQLLKELHRENDSFYFRIDCKSSMDMEKRSAFAKKLAAELERLSDGMLINSAGDYEAELRLTGTKEGMFYPALKCYTLKDERFAYRREAVSASIHPSQAALLMELARPYLKEGAQLLDPFCGVGTMLIERHMAVFAREFYATDTFGEAIEKGRKNAEAAGLPIHFIHRDFFDFTHNYLFDEIVTNMPLRGKKTKEEADAFYARFFDKALTLTAREAVIILYTNELGFVKKQLRLRDELHLLQETRLQEKNEFYLMIIGVKR